MKFPIHLHNAISIYTCARYVKAILTMVMNVRNESHLSMSQIRAIIKTLVIITIDMTCQEARKKADEEEQAANAQYWKIRACCDDDDNYNAAITPNEPVDSLNIGDEHLNTIPATKSDEFIKSCVENLVPYPSESEGESECDMPASEAFTTFSNALFNAEYESDSSDYQSCSDEDFSEEIFSNPLFEEEIIPMKIDQHHINAESDLIESMLNHDSSIIPSSSKNDSLLDEFVEFVSDNSDADIESFSPSPILVENSDSCMEEIDLTFTSDDSMPSGIEEDDDDSERDILILEELFDNYSLSLPVIESLILIFLRFLVLLQNHLMVKDKQEKDKIRTKPDKNGKRGKARQCRRAITIEKEEKEKKYKLKGPIPKS
uniref:Uncharacterized protein n=1 Tax=Tanacetum cinerariifolium TaxID=118510 RepID=A0A6L2K689_TANCI|nr:hypothetical protein [Tanacetum cinerariifolium]